MRVLTYLVACTLLVASVAKAQQPQPSPVAPVEPVAPPPAEAAPPPAEAEPPPPPPPLPVACVPNCRSGFTCVGGQCVSACNPPCGHGEQCTSAGECVPPAAATPPASADVPFEAPQSTVHRHDGFFLRLTAGPGVGVTYVQAEHEGDEVGVVGGGWNASVDIGGSNGDNLAIFGRLRLAQLPAPVVIVDNDTVDSADATANTQTLVGAGISYFIMPLNMYLGAAVGFAVVSGRQEVPGERFDLKYDGGLGFGLDLEIGKEWWVADDWGVGLAGRVSWADVPTGESADAIVPGDQGVGSLMLALLLSATYQ